MAALNVMKQMVIARNVQQGTILMGQAAVHVQQINGAMAMRVNVIVCECLLSIVFFSISLLQLSFK